MEEEKGARTRILAFASVSHILIDGIHALVYPLLPAIASDLKLSYGQASLLRATFNTAGAVFGIPAGVLAERIGEYAVLTTGNLWLAAGLVGMGFSTTFIAVLLLALVGGIGGNAQHPVATSLVSRAYEGAGRGKAIGTLNFTGDIGKLIAPLFAGFVAARYGWRAAFVASGSVVLALLTLLWLGTRGAASTMRTPRVHEETSKASSGTEGWGLVSPFAFVVLVLVGVLDSSVRGSTLTLLPFVLDQKGFGIEGTSAVLSLVFLGGATGKFVCGWIGDRFGTLAVIWVTEAATALTAVLFLFTPTWALVPLALLFGFALNGTSSVLYAAVAQMVVPERRGRVYGVYYTATLTSSAVSPVIYGTLSDMIGLVPAYAIAALVTLAILPLSLGIRRYLREV